MVFFILCLSFREAKDIYKMLFWFLDLIFLLFRVYYRNYISRIVFNGILSSSHSRFIHTRLTCIIIHLPETVQLVMNKDSVPFGRVHIFRAYPDHLLLLKSGWLVLYHIHYFLVIADWAGVSIWLKETHSIIGERNNLFLCNKF